MLNLAKHDSERDYLLLLLMRYGLRCGEIVGWRGLPGIRIEDIRDDGVWAKGKGYAKGIVQDRLVVIPKEVIRGHRRYVTQTFVAQFQEHHEDKMFPIPALRPEDNV